MWKQQLVVHQISQLPLLISFRDHNPQQLLRVSKKLSAHGMVMLKLSKNCENCDVGNIDQSYNYFMYMYIRRTNKAVVTYLSGQLFYFSVCAFLQVQSGIRINLLAYLCFSVLDVAQASAPVSSDIDKRYYNHLISSVSPESHSVPLILHCLLEQVSASCNWSARDKKNLDHQNPQMMIHVHNSLYFKHSVDFFMVFWTVKNVCWTLLLAGVHPRSGNTS